MVRENYVEEALFEHRFWLQVLGDHARFINGSLAAAESEELDRARYFIEVFDSLLERSRGELDRKLTVDLSEASYRSAMELRLFKLHLLQRQLTEKIEFHLPPTFVNHMLNELDEYIRVLAPLAAGKDVPVFGPVHHHLLWLSDAVGHAESIVTGLDMSEKPLIGKSRRFARQFTDFYLKAVEMAGYLRTLLPEFPALSRFNRESELEMLLFQQFLRELEERGLTKELLGTMSPLMADHMYREECYYLTKLSEVAVGVKKPDCHPGKPRVQ